MDITISHTTTQPLFEQIYDQIRDQIRKGSLPPDTPLPSIRTLAKELSVSVITIKRAYDELERDGYVHMVAALAPSPSPGLVLWHVHRSRDYVDSHDGC